MAIRVQWWTIAGLLCQLAAGSAMDGSAPEQTVKLHKIRCSVQLTIQSAEGKTLFASSTSAQVEFSEPLSVTFAEANATAGQIVETLFQEAIEDAVGSVGFLLPQASKETLEQPSAIWDSEWLFPSSTQFRWRPEGLELPCDNLPFLRNGS